MAQLADSFVFDLTDALARDTEDLADLFERVRPAVIHAEAHAQHVCLTLGQRTEDLGQRLREHGIGRCIDRAWRVIVFDKGTDGRIFFVADWHIERERIRRSAVGLDDLFNRKIQLGSDLFQRRLTA